MKPAYAFRFTAMAAAIAAATPAQALEEFFSTPGTRAMGMGGAYVAHASDSSAIWYNPAALALTKDYADVTIEYGDFVISRAPEDLEEDEDGMLDLYDTESNIKYLAFSGGGIGLAYFQPYSFSSSVIETPTFGDPTLQQVDTTYYEMKVAFAGSLNQYLSVGMTIDLISQTVECPECDFTDSEESMGYGYTLGGIGRWTLNQGSQNPVTLKVGANYRSEASMDDLILLDFDQSVVPSRPASLSYGASVGVPFIVGSLPMYIAGSLHLENLSYGETQRSWGVRDQVTGDITNDFASFEFEESRTAVGVEVTFLVKEDLDLYFRLGSASTEVTDDGNGSYTEEPYVTGSESSTMGFGVRFDKLIFDIAMESRTIQQSEFFYNAEDEDEDLTSLSLSYTF